LVRIASSIVRDQGRHRANSAVKRDIIRVTGSGSNRGATMKFCLAGTALAAAVVMAVPTMALATTRHHHHSYAYRHGYPGPSYGYPLAPYGYATPSYSSRYGTYPSWTYDPDPNMRAQLRSEFNRGVDFPGNGGR
jgi:hypothetical protein